MGRSQKIRVTKELINIGEELLNLLRSIILFAKESFADAFRLMCSPKEAFKSLYGVSFYRNAGYLMVNSGVSAILGLVFWIVVARLYSPGDVGLGSALLSMVALLSFIGTLGLGYGIIRFPPDSDNKGRLLNSFFTFAGLAAIAVALIFLAGLSLWAPKLILVRENPVFFAAFVIFTAAATLTQITSYTFIAFRRAGFTLAQGIIAGVLKLALAAGLASSFKVFGIFASWGVAVAVSLGICLLIFLPQLLPRYRPVPSLQRQAGNELVHFSFANYVGEALRGLPPWILPLMILNILSAEENAYFFMAWAMAGILLLISGGVSFSLFAEGSYEEGRLGGDLRRSIKLMALLLIPAILIMTLLGDKILLLFGKEYSLQGTKLLWLLAPAALPASINSLYLGIARVKKKLKEIVLINGVIAFSTLILSYLLLPHLGILGAGVGWLAAQTAVALALLPKLRRGLKFRV